MGKKSSTVNSRIKKKENNVEIIENNNNVIKEECVNATCISTLEDITVKENGYKLEFINTSSPKAKIVDMDIKELAVYKDAIDKLTIHYSNLCEMNKGFDEVIYNESLDVLKKLHSYSKKVNDTIKNKIFSLE